MTNIAGYDNWKLASPDYYETEATECDGCGCEVEDCIADETDFCEDCLCDETEDTECEGCIYCLASGEYDKRKANGTLTEHYC